MYWLLNFRSCDKLRCTSCDFFIVMFDNFEWHKDCDYLFFRNNVPDFQRLKSKLTPQKGNISTNVIMYYITGIKIKVLNMVGSCCCCTITDALLIVSRPDFTQFLCTNQSINKNKVFRFQF